MHPHYHLAGVGGVGMSALAQALADAGASVSGSDRFLDQGEPLEVFDVLRAAGIRLTPQDGSAVTSGTAALIVSTAVEDDNPEVIAARRLGVPLRHRAEMLAEIVARHRVAAIAGTCGKTTVTALTGWLLEAAGFDPRVINGGAVSAWRGPGRVGSVRAGAGDWCVIEADESDRSLLRFTPEWAVITNISKDHFERNEAVDLFATFARRATAGVLAGAEAAALLRAAAPELSVQVIPAALDRTPCPDGGQSFVFEGRLYTLSMPGAHNAENACAALALAVRLGADPARLADGLRAFSGVHRRLERAGACNGATVYDDYAHNPEKIRAAWTAVAGGARRVFGVWRPHGFGPLTLMRAELAAMFAATMRPGDRLRLLPVFYAGGTAKGAVTSADLAADLRAAGCDAAAVDGYDVIEAEARAALQPGDALLVMGARDPHLPRFARRLGQGAAH